MKKFTLLFAALFFAATVVFAQDTRVPITSCTLTGYNQDAFVVSQTNPAATVTAALTPEVGAIWSVDATQSHLMKWDDEHSTFVTVEDDEVLTVGRYKYTLRIAMDGEAVGTYRFATTAADGENTVVTVDGKPWTVTSVLNFSTSSTVWAESDEFLLRNVVSSCSLTGFDQDAFVIGWQYSWEAIAEGLTAEAGVPWQLAYANSRLYKWDAGSGEYKSVDNYTSLTEGKYRFAIQLRIDGDAVLSYRFKTYWDDAEDAIVTVDGVAWEVEQAANYDTYCFLHAWSPEFEPKASEEAISSVEANSTNSTKVLRDGVLLIERGGKTYTAQGQEVR